METKANITFIPAFVQKRLNLANASILPGGAGVPTDSNETVEHHHRPKSTNIFIVDDDPMFLKALELSISSRMSFAKVFSFRTGEACLQHMKIKPDIVVLDYYLNTEIPYAWNGIDILKQIRKISMRTKVIVLSAQDSLNVAIECMDNGAYDYVSKTNSGLMRINNIILNIAKDKELNGSVYRVYQVIFLVLMILAIIYFLIQPMS